MDALFAGGMPLGEFEKSIDKVLKNFSPVGRPRRPGRQYSDTVQAARNELKALILENNFEFSKVKEHLLTIEGDKDRIERFISKLTKRKIHFLYSVLIEHNTPYGECVRDFDWIVKLITGTDALKSIRKPIVQLQLSTINVSGSESKHVYDLNSKVLSKFITQLDDAKFEKKSD